MAAGLDAHALVNNAGMGRCKGGQMLGPYNTITKIRPVTACSPLRMCACWWRCRLLGFQFPTAGKL